MSCNFQEVIRESNATVLGILFAHIHEKSGLHHSSHWCIGGHPIPLLYSGSVPGSKYSLLRFSPGASRIQEMIVLNVQDSNSTVAWPVQLPRFC